jgi:hypothetical protein
MSACAGFPLGTQARCYSLLLFGGAATILNGVAVLGHCHLFLFCQISYKRDSQLDPVIGRVYQILLRAEIAFCRLDRGVSQ